MGGGSKKQTLVSEEPNREERTVLRWREVEMKKRKRKRQEEESEKGARRFEVKKCSSR